MGRINYVNKFKKHIMKNGLRVAFDGTQYWFQNGVLHGEDGPAIERLNEEDE